MRVAVVGAGVSGLGAAHVLARAHDVTLFDREPRAGGHVRTVRRDGLALDTGFLVHNGPNYPLLSRLRRDGLVESTWQESPSGPPRRYYRLTDGGRAALAEFRLEWRRFRDAVDHFVERRAQT